MVLWRGGGDLNEILWDNERCGGKEGPHIRSKFLHDFVEKMELIDLGCCGPRFTWRRTRNNVLVQERLDRGLVNAQWLIQWPNTMVTHGTV